MNKNDQTEADPFEDRDLDPSDIETVRVELQELLKRAYADKRKSRIDSDKNGN